MGGFVILLVVKIMRLLLTLGLNWIKKEQTAVGELLKTSGIVSGARTSNYTGGSGGGTSGIDVDPAKRKLGSLFLGKKK